MRSISGIAPGKIAHLIRSLPKARRRSRDLQAVQWLFVVGPGYSGTTLLASMIGSHADVVLIPRETHAFGRRGEPEWLRRAWGRLTVFNALDAHCSAVPLPGAVLEKSPSHSHSVPTIRAAFRGAKFVAIARDPRDAVASRVATGVTVEEALRVWLDEAMPLADQCGNEDFLLIRYEDLVTNPAAVLDAVQLHLGLEPQNLLAYHASTPSWIGSDVSAEAMGSPEPDPKDHARHRDWQVHQPLISGRVGRFLEHVSEDEADAIGAATASVARRLGYEW